MLDVGREGIYKEPKKQFKVQAEKATWNWVAKQPPEEIPLTDIVSLVSESFGREIARVLGVE